MAACGSLCWATHRRAPRARVASSHETDSAPARMHHGASVDADARSAPDAGPADPRLPRAARRHGAALPPAALAHVRQAAMSIQADIADLKARLAKARSARV